MGRTTQCLVTASLVISLTWRMTWAYVVPVEDLGVLGQQILGVAKMVQSNTNEALMIKQQLEAYALMLRNLKNIPSSLVHDLQEAMGTYRSLLTTAERLSYDLTAVQTQVATLQRAGIEVGGVNLTAMRAQWTHEITAAATTAIKTQAIAGEQQRDQARVGQALSISNAAVGNLDVTQASNELLGLIAKQNAEALQLQATNGRVQTLYYGRLAAGEEAASQSMEAWLKRDKTAIPDYQPPGQTSGGLPMPKLQ